MRKLLKGFLINLQFFTAIPVHLELPMDKPHLKSAVQAFPLLGLFQGGLYAGLFYLFLEYTPFSNLTVAFFLWLMSILLTGGIHLDGWIDASDGYFSYKDQQKRLQVMNDPRTGAFGVISVIVLLTSRFLFIYEITVNVHMNSYLMIAAIPLISKSIMGLLLLTVKSAKKEGLGALFQNAASPKDLWTYLVYVIGFLAIVIVFDGGFYYISIIFASAIVILLFCRRKAVKWFGGITGDVLGAAVEGTELLLWMTLWLLHYSAMD
ncbi:adenosylcobinamide-GDP ribazoletransferase [Neobacillus sp. DY30]|uniref:adenosylcobinamide-GDP ribazoletransferase n=1 Tax=Neobacillus sp. DY30 TaxID=3047871 RepID=UPI0024BFE3A4|nr:adenosylcobinamide-GDP ribazoletransferase [Neobacillus sp. DY30]WHY02971.1 adenosylcobinamide-GDP ribazoletransferase [Neobacillus sp. DY30]